jgi:CHAD domain-containing protein
MASGDPALEQNIVQNVASYGRQLGRVADVLNVLIATKGNLAQLTPAQQQQIDAFQQLTEQINAAKKDHPQELSSADTQKFLDRLTALKAANPALYDTLRKKINAAINA